ncbi:MAG: bacteriohemerythrin [Desulfobulbaceae bacterium]|nr:bacteriohemerythrin [Desulfobulbaceae bacterium]
MSCSEWRQEFLVGVEEVDAQHQQLFGMLSHLQEAITRRAEDSELGVIVDGLIVYLKEHFDCEQALLLDHPGWPEHHRQHWQFTEKVLWFLREFKRSEGQGGNGLAHEMYDFLCGWLKEHIVEVDRRYFLEEASTL